MKKDKIIKALVLGIICLFVGVGIQPAVATVEPREEKVDIDPKDLLFQTIIDIANNEEIQSIIQNSHIGMLSSSPFLTKRYLNFAYNMGLILSKTNIASRIQPLFKLYQVGNQGLQERITSIIENDDELNSRIGQLVDLSCDCENDVAIGWPFPVICSILYVLLFIGFLQLIATGNSELFVYVVYTGITFNCPFV